jgi:hypothetical protein
MASTIVGVQTISPYTPPPGGVLATSVDQMYVIHGDLTASLTYNVGTPIVTQSKHITISNKCILNSLHVDVSVPSFYSLLTPVSFDISPSDFQVIYYRIDEASLQAAVAAGNTFLDQDITLSFTPLNVTGPVYINPLIDFSDALGRV